MSSDERISGERSSGQGSGNPTVDTSDATTPKSLPTEAAAKIVSEFRDLVAKCHRLAYAVPGEHAWPEIAHAPFVTHAVAGEEGFFVLGSTLSRGSRCLLSAAGAPAPRTTVLLVADAADSVVEEPFARTRAQLVVRVEAVSRDNPLWSEVVTKLASRFGETARLLEQLADFHVMGLFPSEGLFIKGFGKAFSLSGKNLKNVAHLRQS